MLKQIIFLNVAIAFLAMEGCGFSLGNTDDQQQQPNNPKTDVNGQKPADYYAQFTSKAKPQSPQDMKILISKTSFPLNNQPFPVTIKLVLVDDNTYDLLYTEDQNGLSQELKGNWSINNTNLVLANLATGNGAEINGHHGIELQMQKDILMPGLNGKTIEFTI